MSFISVGQENTDDLGGFLDLIDYVGNLIFPPNVLSTSYGFNENAISASLATFVISSHIDYMNHTISCLHSFRKFCDACMGLGALGISVLFLSGTGAATGFDYGQSTCTEFVPTFPASCPL